jgi:hypothetical protein
MSLTSQGHGRPGLTIVLSHKSQFPGKEAEEAVTHRRVVSLSYHEHTASVSSSDHRPPLHSRCRVSTFVLLLLRAECRRGYLLLQAGA